VEKYPVLALTIFPGVSSIAGDLENANKLFSYAEQNYAQYFAPANAATIHLLGYIARQYSATDNYLGIKDGWV